MTLSSNRNEGSLTARKGHSSLLASCAQGVRSQSAVLRFLSHLQLLAKVPLQSYIAANAIKHEPYAQVPPGTAWHALQGKDPLPLLLIHQSVHEDSETLGGILHG